MWWCGVVVGIQGGDLQVFRRVDKQHKRHQDRVEGEGDHIGRQHAHAEEEEVEVRLMEGGEGRLGHRHARRGPQLHRPARPPALLLAVGLVVGGDLVRALYIVPPHELPSLRTGPRATRHTWEAGREEVSFLNGGASIR